ncbi:hypothetical protein [Tahibacter sp.]|uniref:hypothetical protein n=1 Tax=Tahibacter sp. TaxID=2056211 RepID=UPI0028C3E9A8|nr:hypothetical protein [Tahibacter sp.]
MQDEQVVQLLREIRDGQQELIALHRETAQRSLQAQQTTIDIQRRGARLYRIVVSVGAVALAILFYYFLSL